MDVGRDARVAGAYLWSGSASRSTRAIIIFGADIGRFSSEEQYSYPLVFGRSHALYSLAVLSALLLSYQVRSATLTELPN